MRPLVQTGWMLFRQSQPVCRTVDGTLVKSTARGVYSPGVLYRTCQGSSVERRVVSVLMSVRLRWESNVDNEGERNYGCRRDSPL
jgi:hypothetical protein